MLLRLMSLFSLSQQASSQLPFWQLLLRLLQSQLLRSELLLSHLLLSMLCRQMKFLELFWMMSPVLWS